MKLAVAILLLSTLAWCQPSDTPQYQPQLRTEPWPGELPDTPQPQEPPAPARCGPKWLGGCWNYGHPTLTIGQTFKSPWFYGPTTMWLGSAVFDNEVTHAYLGKPCTESNRDLPFMPTRGQLYLETVKTDLPLIALGWGMVKLNRRVPRFMYIGMATYATQSHLRGAVSWFSCH